MYCVDPSRLYFNAYPSVRKVVCKETAARMQGLIAGYNIPLRFYYQDGDVINSFYIKGTKNANLDNLLIENQNGIEITSPEQTIYDLLADFDESSLEGIDQAICNYYYRNNKTFEKLLLILGNGEIRKRFDLEKDEALSYYDE